MSTRSASLPTDGMLLPIKNIRFVLAATVLLLVTAGCDPSVDSFEDNGLDYSIFGYLNASADTQFVRVEPLRDGMLTRAPENLDAEVTLTNLATDRTVSLQDSLFRYIDDATAHNFYTTFDIKPTTPYRLLVQGPGEAESQVQTTVPDTFPPPTVSASIPDCFPNCPPGANPDCGVTEEQHKSLFATVLVEDIERLVAVRALYYMEEPRGVWSFGHLADTTHTRNGTIRAQVDYGKDWCTLPTAEDGDRVQRRIEVVVAAASPDWPEFLRMDFETEVLPGVASNVEGGVGFLGGIVTDTVAVYPYEE